MKEWFISGWLHLSLGFGIGWIVFKRPAFADAIIAKIWAWISGLFAPLIAKIKSKV